jgi:Ca2+-binding RTX toxin-like protein
VEGLETRELKSTINFDPGTRVLTINGSDGPDTAQVYIDSHSTPYIFDDDMVALDMDGTRSELRIHLYSPLSPSPSVLQVVFYGNGGNDSFWNGTSIPDYADGGSGYDSLVGGSGANTLIGGTENDWLVGGAAADSLYGGDGGDSLFGGGQNDYLDGGDDNDQIHGGEGSDYIRGGDGDDYLYGDAGDNWIYGGAGNDHLYGGEGRDFLNGDGDNDVIDGAGGDDTISGGQGNDLIVAGPGRDQVSGDQGDDTIYGGADPNSLSGGPGNDTIYGGESDDTIHGGEDNDYVDAGGGNDLVYGEGGTDSLWGSNGNDTIYGGAGNDSIYGNADNDVLLGEGDNDTIFGGDGNDLLVGGTGDDYLNGGQDKDILIDTSGYNAVFGDQSISGDGAVDLGVTTDSLSRTDLTGVNVRISLANSATRAWSDADVLAMAPGLRWLLDNTTSPRIFRLASGSPLTFQRIDTIPSSEGSRFVVYGDNDSRGLLRFTDAAFPGLPGSVVRTDVTPASKTVVHEIGHDWDDENPNWSNFMALSGWRPLPVSSPVPAGYTRAMSLGGTPQPYVYVAGTPFARLDGYGRTNPYEDFATSLEVYYSGENPRVGWMAKSLFIGDFLRMV